MVLFDDDTDPTPLAAMFPDKRALAVTDVHDGTSNTILVVESTDHSVDWLEPTNITVDQLMRDSPTTLEDSMWRW